MDNIISIKPNSKKIGGIITAPGSKSVTIRALIIASLVKGKTLLKGVLRCNDTNRLMEALNKCGIIIKDVSNNTIEVTGGETLTPPRGELYLGEGATPVRLIIALIAIRGKGRFVLRVSGLMKSRPIKNLKEILEGWGVRIDRDSHKGTIVINTRGKIKPEDVNVCCEKTSQYLTSLLICAPYLSNEININVSGKKIVSKNYIDITVDIMKKFGARIKVSSNKRKYKVDINHKYKPRTYKIEGDYSSASYAMALAAINESKIEIKNLRKNSKQGDRQFIKVLENMGCSITLKPNSIVVKGGRLKGIKNLNMNNMPDTVQTTCVVASFARGKTRICDIKHLAHKETNRITNLTRNLQMIGVNAKHSKNTITISNNGKVSLKKNVLINSYNDHRMVMSFSLIGSRIPIRIEDKEYCFKKSYPNYFKDLKKLGVDVH